MRAVISTVLIAGAALLASACTSTETTNITNTTTEVVPVENVTSDTMVTNIDASAPANTVEITTNTVEVNTTNAM